MTTRERTGPPRTAAIERHGVERLAAAMRARLRGNRHKGGWRDCDLAFLLGRLNEEVSELEVAALGGRALQVLHEAADVANFAMMIADIAQQRAKRGELGYAAYQIEQQQIVRAARGSSGEQEGT